MEKDLEEYTPKLDNDPFDRLRVIVSKIESMKLSLPFLDKKEVVSYFLVLVLRHNKASAVIFEESQGTAKVINSHSENFITSVEDADDEELLNTLDKTISKAESVLPSHVETQKTIFGLKQNWIDENNKIKKDYLEKLKKISDDLGLVPVGFLVTTEAISHLLAKEEGAPVSAVIAEIDKNYVSASLIRAGKIIEVQDSVLDQNPMATVDNLLKRFENAEVLPSRIIIFDGERDLSQQFIGHTWSKTLPFLHLPQITNLEKGFDARAVLSGAATEMGFSVLNDIPTPRQSTQPMGGDLEKIDMGNPDEPAETIEEDTTQQDEITPDNNPEKETEAPESTHAVSQEASSDFFGFVKDKDIAGESPKISAEPEQNFQNVPMEVLSEEIEEIPQQREIEVSEKKQLPINAAIILEGARKILRPLIGNFTKLLSTLPGLKSLPMGGRKIILLPAILFLLFILLFIYYLTGRNATITLDINAKKISQQKDVTFSTSSGTDVSKNIIAGQFAEIKESGSSSTKATGSKDIGTPAKGTVTIFNIDDTITLSQGTKITSSNNLTFTLDKSVTVASGSADPLNPSSGKADVTVTATDIGTNYNLPSNTKFSFQGNNSIAAKNDNPFSGGTKKTITVVSKEDTAKLESDLIKSLESKAKDEIVNKIPSGNILLPTFVDEILTNKKMDKNVGDEASSITLNADVNYKSIYYNKSDMASFVKGTLDIPSGLNIDENNIVAEATDLKTSEDSVSTTLNISAFLVPIIDKQDLAKQISGKSVAEAQKMLANITQVSNAAIKIIPNIPLFPKNLPSVSKIKFNINSNE